MGQRGTYSFENATPVFAQTGGPGILLPSSRLNVDFLAYGAYVDVNLDIGMPNSVLYNLRGGVSTNNSLPGTAFGVPLVLSGLPCLAANSFCKGFGAEGGFSGRNAERALLQFGAANLTNGVFWGAATFSRTTQATTPSNSLTDLRTHLTDGGAIVTNTTFATVVPSSITTATFEGEKLVKLVEFAGSTVTFQSNNLSTVSYGALGATSDPDFLGWGFWDAGSKSISSASATTAMALNAVHHVIGRPTPNALMPLTGTFNYSLIGGTAPTATLSGTTQTGQLINSSLSANFGSGTVTANIGTQFGTIPVNIGQVASFTPGTANFSGSSTSPLATSISGFFSGNHAYRAGLVFNTTHNTLGQVTGAAVFQRSN